MTLESALAYRYFRKDLGTNAKRYLLHYEVGFIRRVLMERDEPGNLIDLGCGSGGVTLPLYKMGFHVSGLDLNRVALTAFQQESKDVPLVQGDCLCLPFASGSLNCIAAIHCFDHLDRVQFLHECRRVLNQEGLLIFDALNRHSYKFPLKRLRYRTSIRTQPGFLEKYVNVFSWREVHQALTRAGFDIHAVSGYGWVPFTEKSESKLVNAAARLEKVLQLNRFPGSSPRILVAARK